VTDSCQVVTASTATRTMRAALEISITVRGE
jgi:hypothetical protein